MKSRRIGIRISEDLRTQIDQAGDTSSVARALLVLGLATIGALSAPLLDDASSALAGVSDPQIRAALMDLFNKGSTFVEHQPQGMEHTSMLEADLSFDADPLLSAGIEV